MVITNTWVPEGNGPTFFANEQGSIKRSSRIGYILIPSSQLGNIRKMQIKRSIGVLIQCGQPTAFEKDHVPAGIEMAWPSINRPTQTRA